MPNPNILIFFVSFVLTTSLTGLVLLYARRVNLLDVPNQRSSHQLATPRGGGLGIVFVFLCAVVVLYFFGNLPFTVCCSLMIGGGLIAGIGFVDDHNHVPASWRLIVQLAAAILAVAILGGLPAIRLGGMLIDLGLVGDILAIVFVVSFINLYNFMDGIDGIAAVEASFIAGSALVIASIGPSIGDSEFMTTLLVVFVAAVLGFLVWNWPPAKIFMGDVGSGFIGFVLAVFAIISTDLGMLPIWSWLILSGVFLIDSTVTLVTRALNGEEWYSAHNNHAYQKASRRLKGHRPVTLSVLAINLLWLLPIAWFASLLPEFGWWLTGVAWVPLICGSQILGSGRPEVGV
jgi:Fuc2NAc and GlcNAc transferase